MSDSPLVSVIIPCHNQGAYLREAIDSVLGQSYPSFEIIVVNDGSTDAETISLLRGAVIPKTKILHTDNEGVSAARNCAIREARGEFFLPLDADDKIGPDYLQTAINALCADPHVGIVYCEAEYFGEKNGPVCLPEFSIPELLTECGIFCSAVFRKSDWEKVNGFKMDMTDTLEDYDFWVSVVSLGRKVVRLPECHFYYRIKSGSRSAACGNEQYLLMRRKVYERHRELYFLHADALFTRLFELSRENIRLRAAGGWTLRRAIRSFLQKTLYRSRRLLTNLLRKPVD